MNWFLLGIALVVGTILLARWYVSANPGTIYKTIRWVGLSLALVVGTFLLVTGKLNFLWIAAAFLLPWIGRLRMLRNIARAARGPSGGQTSTVRTRFVAMELDHDTGDMDGEIREGPHAGQRLSDLTMEQVIELLHVAWQEDAQSSQVLQAYLDRMHGDDWREKASAAGGGAWEEAPGGGPHGGPGGCPQSGPMSRDEAFEVLGLAVGAGEDEIKHAHRELIRKFHPDHGGSDHLAAKINQAKDVLLGD